MVNYKQGKIYKIISSNTDKIYVGSTCEKYLSKRLQKHKGKFKCKKSYYTSFEILKLGDYQIILLESYSCNNRDELRARERYYIENNDCVNKNIPSRTRKEYYEDNFEKERKYMKEYRGNHKEEGKEYQKKWYNKNKEEISKKSKLERKNKVKITCICGGTFSYNKTRHEKSVKHMNYVNKQSR